MHAQIITLFRFAKAEGHIAQDRDTEPEKIKKLEKPRDATPPGIYAADELRIILARVDAKWTPAIVLGAFAGLRPCEIERLQWSDVLFDDALVHIRHEVAKRTTRKLGDARYAPMPANLVGWLKPWRDAKGAVCPLGRDRKGAASKSGRSDRVTATLGKLLPGGKWKQDGLRHSWVSYRAAETSNLPLVAREAGNSTEVARSAYENPRMKREAVAWFSIFPETEIPANVIELAKA